MAEYIGVTMLKDGVPSNGATIEDMTITSARETMTLVDTIDDSFTIDPYPASGNAGTRTIYHNLAYVPLIVGYVQGRSGLWYPFPHVLIGYSVLPAGWYGAEVFTSFRIDDEKVTFDYDVYDFIPFVSPAQAPNYAVTVNTKLFCYTMELGI